MASPGYRMNGSHAKVCTVLIEELGGSTIPTWIRDFHNKARRASDDNKTLTLARGAVAAFPPSDLFEIETSTIPRRETPHPA